MTAIASDDFNRADAVDLGTDWSKPATGVSLQDFVVVSNQALPDVTNGFDAVSFHTAGVPPDQYSEAVLKDFTGTTDQAGIGCLVRGASSGGLMSLYRAVANSASSNNSTLAKFVNDTYTLLAQDTFSWDVNDVLSLSVEGTTLRLSRNGIAVLVMADASLSAGSVGVSFSSQMTSAALDDWEGGLIDLQEQGGTEPNIEGMARKIGAI